MKYKFEKELKEAILIKRNSQFTMDIEIDREVEKAHWPTTNRIGDIETKNIACLVSISYDPKRKLKYTVEAYKRTSQLIRRTRKGNYANSISIWIGYNNLDKKDKDML